MTKNVELPYVHNVVAVRVTPNGFQEIDGLDAYKGAYIRNRVVCRLDIFTGMKEFISEENLIAYRKLIYTIVAGSIANKESISKVLKALYVEDTMFKRFLGEIIYFNEDLEENSLYSVILDKMLKNYVKHRERVLHVLETYHIKVLFESQGYLYISIPDVYGAVVIPEGYREEVISSGKVWDGSFSFHR